MRVAQMPILCLLLSSSLVAAPIRPAPKLTPKQQAELRSRAQSYAARIFRLTGEVRSRYVHPVSQRELIRAAFQGLYDAARRPIPLELPDRVAKARSDSDWIALLIEARMSLGLHSALENNNDLLMSCHAIVRKLDQCSELVTSSRRRFQPLHETAGGIGVTLEQNLGAGPTRIRAVAPGSPAQRMGIRPGDVITHVNGVSVQSKASGEVEKLLNVEPPELIPAATPGEPEAPLADPRVTLTLARRREAVRTVTLEKKLFHVETILGVMRNGNNSWSYWLDRKHRIAHVRVARLARGAAKELSNVMAGLKTAGLRGLLLDLRWCPGGYVSEATALAGLFLDDVVVCSVKERDGSKSDYRGGQSTRFLDVPIIVLVNEETSGGGELIAAALKDHGRAQVAGQRTRGKASVQTAIAIGGDVSMKLTTGYFLRPNGKSLHRFVKDASCDKWGVDPDDGLELRVSPELQVRLRQSWEEQSLRPGNSKKTQPMDDPLNDPQRLLALRALQDRLDGAGKQAQRTKHK